MLDQKTDDGECHPIAYASRCTNQAEQKYGVCELEVAALLFAFEGYTRTMVLAIVTVPTQCVTTTPAWKSEQGSRCSVSSSCFWSATDASC